MITKSSFTAVDFGAESGRAILGKVENEKLSSKETQRFPSKPLNFDGHIYWDLFYLFNEIKTSLSKIA